MPKITPETCTKEELVWWVNKQLGRSKISFVDFSTEICAYRTSVILQEMNKLTKKHDEVLQKYQKTAKPHIGKKLSEIPKKDLQKLAAQEDELLEVAKKIERLDKKLGKLGY